MTPLLSVIVLNYNGRQWLGPCLDALAAQAGAPPFEIVVADNGSTDGSAEFIAGAYPQVRFVGHGANHGFAAGNNLAARAARGSILVFLNNDTVPAGDWLARLYAAFTSATDRALVTSRLVSLSGPEVIDSAGDGYFIAGGAYKRGHGLAPGGYLEPREVFGACGAAFMIARDLFETLGGFDERFFMVYEDVDLSYRARLAGHRCWYAADAVVRHAGSGTLGTLSPAAVFHGQRNLEWTWIKNTPAGMLLRTLPAHVLYSLAGVGYYIARGRGGAAVRGKLAAFAGLPGIFAKRREVQRMRRVDARALARVMDRGWLTAKRREKAILP